MAQENPFSEHFYEAFKNLFLGKNNFEKGFKNNFAIEKIVKIYNDFFAEDAPKNSLRINADNHNINGKVLLDFVRDTRRRMIDCGMRVENLTEDVSRSPALIKLFDDIKNFVVKYSAKTNEDYEYSCFDVDKKSLSVKKFEENKVSSAKQIFFFPVERVNQDEEAHAKKIIEHASGNLFGDKIFKDVDVKMVSVPWDFPEWLDAANIFHTMTDAEFAIEADKKFVMKHWGKFIGKDLEFDEEGNVVAGLPYEKDVLKEKLQSLTVFGYCAGAANAHRCLGYLKKCAEKLYDKDVVNEVWKNINAVNFAFPLESEKVDYTMTALMCKGGSNTIDDDVVYVNFPSQYRTKSLEGNAKIKVCDEDNCKYVCLRTPDKVVVKENDKLVTKIDMGVESHKLQNITIQNAVSNNRKCLEYIFASVLKNQKPNNRVLANIATYGGMGGNGGNDGR